MKFSFETDSGSKVNKSKPVFLNQLAKVHRWAKRFDENMFKSIKTFQHLNLNLDESELSNVQQIALRKKTANNKPNVCLRPCQCSRVIVRERNTTVEL